MDAFHRATSELTGVIAEIVSRIDGVDWAARARGDLRGGDRGARCRDMYEALLTAATHYNECRVPRDESTDTLKLRDAIVYVVVLGHGCIDRGLELGGDALEQCVRIGQVQLRIALFLLRFDATGSAPAAADLCDCDAARYVGELRGLGFRGELLARLRALEAALARTDPEALRRREAAGLDDDEMRREAARQRAAVEAARARLEADVARLGGGDEASRVVRVRRVAVIVAGDIVRRMESLASDKKRPRSASRSWAFADLLASAARLWRKAGGSGA